METAILTGESKTNMRLLFELAKKLGLKGKILTKTETEDLGLGLAIKKGRTGKHVDTAKFLKGLVE